MAQCTMPPARQLASLLLLLAPAAGAGEASLLEPVRDRLAERRSAIAAAAEPRAHAELLLETGAPAAAVCLLSELGEQAHGRLLAIRILLANHELSEVGPRVEALDRSEPEQRHTWYDWSFVIDDLAAIDETSCAALETDPEAVVDRLAAGRLRQLLLDTDGAEDHFAHALERATSSRHRVLARRGLSTVAYKRHDYGQSLGHLEAALDEAELDPELLTDLGLTLIRLGRTDEAIEAFELAVDLAPFHERAHYMLGNGYARKSYTQLYAAYPKAFADEAGREPLAAADQLRSDGAVDRARTRYASLHEAHPRWVDVMVRLGSLAFSAGRYHDARDIFASALEVCPEYGRAHNGIAKALEAERLQVEVHRQAYEATFAATAMPAVARIDELVSNWHSLSPRHQKQVALAVAPWRRYLPVLIEGGLTYYIKPLFQLLSETPGQETLRDLRISYDSRLWDDVRGCGGYHTVTGVEDVERTVLGRYNTVLHELTHQVHGVLSASDRRRIQELYRQTKERDDGTGAVFLSRYAGGSVWEYFAEGANSWASPQRDDYDTREIVRQRLDRLDPALKALFLELSPAPVLQSATGAKVAMSWTTSR